MLEARGVDLQRGHRRVLAGVDLAVSPGEFVALCGPNGAGKSSLLAVLSGELLPGAGAALIGGRPIASLPAAVLAAERAVLEQAPSLGAPFTVAALLGLGLACLDRVRIDEGGLIDRALAATGLAGYAARPADRLSGGEQARAHLARVLVQLWAGRATGRGHFLLLDEPTASLDLSHQLMVMRTARAEAQAGAGVVAVLHDLTLAANFADRVIMMSHGRVAAAGRPEEVMEPELLASIYDAPVRVERVQGALHVLPDLGKASLQQPCSPSATGAQQAPGRPAVDIGVSALADGCGNR